MPESDAYLKVLHTNFAAACIHFFQNHSNIQMHGIQSGSFQVSAHALISQHSWNFSYKGELRNWVKNQSIKLITTAFLVSCSPSMKKQIAFACRQINTLASISLGVLRGIIVLMRQQFSELITRRKLWSWSGKTVPEIMRHNTRLSIIRFCIWFLQVYNTVDTKSFSCELVKCSVHNLEVWVESRQRV